MIERDLSAIVAGVTPVLREHFQGLAARLLRESEQAETLRASEHRALMAEHRAWMVEERAALGDLTRQISERLATVRDGVDGQHGLNGTDGRDGIDGKDGAAGADGINGVDGTNGTNGTNGADGRDGIDGKDGAPGADGINGSDGAKGVDGTDGINGADGINGSDGAPGRYGIDGKDGLDGADGAPGADGKDGANGVDGADAYPGQARGLYDASATYRALDVVSFNGSEWRAKTDSPGELPGEGWMLSAQRGKRGDRGEQGPIGKAGNPGASIIAGKADGSSMQLTLARDDGEAVTVDLYELADAIRSA